MKNKVLLTVALVALVLFACRKEFRSSDYATTAGSSDFAVSDARHYFYNVARKQADPVTPVNNLSTSSTQHNATSMYGHNNKILPYWKFATTGSNANYQYVEMPYTSKAKFASFVHMDGSKTPEPEASNPVLTKSLKRLILYKNKAGKINQRLVTYIPTAKYLAAHNNDISHNRIGKLDDDFNGYLEYKNINGKFLFVLKIKNGKAVKKYKAPPTGRPRNTGPVVQSVNMPKTAGTGTVAPNTVYTYCVTPYVEHYEMTPCSDEGGDDDSMDNPDVDPNDPESGGDDNSDCGTWVLVGIDYGDTVCTDIDDGQGDPDPCLDPANMNSAECGGDPDPEDPDPGCQITQSIVDGKVVFSDGCAPPAPPDPCALAKSMVANANYHAIVTLMKDELPTADHEYAYFNLFNPATNTFGYTSAQGTSGSYADDVTIPTGIKIKDMAHIHNAGGLSIFSPQDLQGIYSLEQLGDMSSASTFSTTVMTSTGTYMLTISDLTKFNTFGAGNLTSANISGFSISMYNVWNINGTKTAAQNEIGFMNALQHYDTGLSLLKMDSTGKFNEMTLNPDGNAITITGCN